MGCEGHPQAITPHMDRLAAKGMRFSRAYTQNPVCTPSRVSILSGQYCHNHGFYDLSGPANYSLPSFLGHLRERGYKTAALGKIHLPDVPHDWILDHVDLLGEYMHRHPFNAHHQWARQQGFFDEIDHGRIPDLPGGQQHEARASRLTFEQSGEGFTVSEACRFMDGCDDAPWAMQVSFFRPHQCYTPEQRFWDLYPEDLELPVGLTADATHRPPHFQKMVDDYRAGEGPYEPKEFEAWARRVWRGYLACISHCDHALGVLLDHLEELGIADNTAVVYHSDHGAYSGTYGVPEKAPGICSDAVCRVPMIWHVPGIGAAGGACDQLVENIDLAPTICALAGVEPMSTCDGHDLSPLLRGENAAVRELAVTENVWSKAIRWDRWRMVHYQPEMFDGGYRGELYDMEADPHETRNLFEDSDHLDVVHEGRRMLLEWLIRTTRARTVMMKGQDGDPDAMGLLAADGTRNPRYGPAEALRRGTTNYI